MERSGPQVDFRWSWELRDVNPQTGEDCESKKNPEGCVGPLFSTSDLHSVPAGLCNWYWRTQGMFSLNLGLVTSRNDRSTPRDSVLPSRSEERRVGKECRS